MRIRLLIAGLGLGVALLGCKAEAQKLRGTSSKRAVSGVTIQLTNTPVQGQVHWKVVNNSSESVFVYSFYLYGPAYATESHPDRTAFDTTPPALKAGCPNRFPPVLLLVVPAGDYREGDFRDGALKEMKGKNVSLKIGVGFDPYSVVDEARRIRRNPRDCARSPYDAVFEWATIIESNAVQL